MRWRVFLLPLIPLSGITILSEVAVRSGRIPAFLLPAPSRVFGVIAEDRATFIQAFVETAEASILG
ncbi:MAG: ABC transporter permease, partial [Proteobacteria bacterium]|nr:ABC transporter permease [Pseudomonadota bacterium]